MQSNSNLVWIDLEMTGLDAKKDVILEIACIITDGNLTVLAEGPSLVINHSEEVLAGMDTWSKEQHMKSGLIERVRMSSITTEQAEKQVMDFIKKYCLPNTALLAGNSVWQDRIFLHTYMPSIVNYLYYRLVDVTTVKELVKHWYSDDPRIEFKKTDTHRALQDIHESIQEIKHFRKYFFV
jgi:oligoribonuclease